MTLDKAIEVATLLERTLAPQMSADGTDALKLLIEAGKAWAEAREDPDFTIAPYLPGED
ncbi:hypothetical protein ES703_67093 [subsurface metagenome]